MRQSATSEHKAPRYSLLATRPSPAALGVIGLERALRIFWEPSWQRWALGVPGMERFWNGVYLWLHTPLVIFTLVYLYLRHRPTYTVIRNVFFVSAAIG